jgi:hypothetical protein
MSESILRILEKRQKEAIGRRRFGIEIHALPGKCAAPDFSTDSICYSVGFYQSLTSIHHLFDTFVI